jgi:uncharacterized integral membrane protein
VRFVYWSVTLLVAIILTDFAVSNLEPVVVGLWPLADISTRLCVVALLALLLGFLVGELVAWINGRGWRQEARRRARRIEALERELGAVRAEIPARGDATRLPATTAPRD